MKFFIVLKKRSEYLRLFISINEAGGKNVVSYQKL